MSRKEISIGQAGALLRMSYNQVQRLVMLGRLTGGQDENQRWWVDAGDVARFLRDQRKAS